MAFVAFVSLWLTFRVQDIAAVLLAAGRSRRMGKFKPLLPFGDHTVIEASVQSLQEAGVSEIVVVVGHRADEIQEHLKEFDLKFAWNPNADSPMSESIRAGVEALSSGPMAALI